MDLLRLLHFGLVGRNNSSHQKRALSNDIVAKIQNLQSNLDSPEIWLNLQTELSAWLRPFKKAIPSMICVMFNGEILG